MLRLNLARAPYWLDLAQGVRVEVEPVGSTILAAASQDAYVAPSIAPEEGAEGSEDAAQPMATPNAGEQNVAYIKAIARRAIRSWEGVMDEVGKPLPVKSELVDALFEQSPSCLRAFREGYVNKGEELLTEGNGSAPSLDGTTAGATGTAEAASDDAPSARRGKTAPKA